MTRAGHEIVLHFCAGDIALSCTCCKIPRKGRQGYAPIAIRRRFPAAEAIAAWRAYHGWND